MGRPSRILIVDDHAGDRQLLRDAIQETGWHVELLEAENSPDAIALMRQQALKQEPPDLVLIDYFLTGETSLEVIPRMRSVGGYEYLPIMVLTTAKPPEVARLQLYAVGVLKILLKASDYPSLLEMVATLRRMLTKRGDISGGGSWLSDSDLALLGED